MRIIAKTRERKEKKALNESRETGGKIAMHRSFSSVWKTFRSFATCAIDAPETLLNIHEMRG